MLRGLRKGIDYSRKKKVKMGGRERETKRERDRRREREINGKRKNGKQKD